MPGARVMYNRGMKKITQLALFGCAFLAACGSDGANVANAPAPSAPSAPNAASSNTSQTRTQPMPSNKFTKDDVAKLKWIEGSWKGMDGENPFYERYKIEGETMIVEELNADGSVRGPPGRYELKDGEFGKEEGDLRSAASEIGDGYVQFVPGTESKGNSYRFERIGPDSWQAILEWPAAADRTAQRKVYRMERMKQ